MTKNLILLLFLLAFSVIKTQGEETIYIDEKFLKESLSENPPTVDQINATLFNAQVGEKRIDDQFNTNLEASANYLRTEEKQFAQFIPVTSPVSEYNVKVSRAFTNGVSVGLRGFSEQFSNNFVADASTAGISFQLGVNLWKDLISKRTESQLEQAKAGSQQAQWESEIALATFQNSLRKIYWSLVANAEALKISEGLIKTSEKQVKEAKNRLKNNIADAGEVARYQSQLSARKANIISLKYEKASLVQSLKELLPHISLKNVELKPYDINSTIGEVLACTSIIASEGAPPLKHTYYDEIVNLLDKQEKLDKRINDSYDDIDVQLQSEVGLKGRDNSRSDSFSDLSDDGRENYAVGLTLNIPLEQKKKTTREILNKASKLRYRSQKQRELARIKAFHTQVVRQISLLREIIRNQQENTKYLGLSLKTSKKKYNQARLTVEQLVQEQDAYLQSNLDEIRTKLTVINTIFDYLSVYTKTPCAMNTI